MYYFKIVIFYQQNVYHNQAYTKQLSKNNTNKCNIISI